MINKAQELAKLNRDELLSVLENLPYATGVFDAEFRYIYYNPAGEKMSGVPLEKALGKLPHELLPPMVIEKMLPLLKKVRETKLTIEEVIEFDFGSGPIYLQLVYVPLVAEDGRFKGILGITEDVTKENIYEKQLRHQAHHDALTGLINRFYLREIGAALSHQSTTAQTQYALLFLDLDNFKNVNDFYGHTFGDNLLCLVADRLRTIAENNHIARIGGDEFIILQDKIASSREAEEFAARVHQIFAQPLLVDEQEIYISTSIGIAIFPEHGRNINHLMKNADVALYKAKKKGKGQSRIFNDELKNSTLRRLSLEHKLSHALFRNELYLAYQPIASFKNDALAGCEALLRWQSPELGAIGPDEFIPIAENGGMIPALTDFVLKTALDQLANLRGNRQNFYVSVNLSPVQFQSRALVKYIAEAIVRANVDPSLLQLEITESAFLDGFLETVYILDGLHDLGVRLALDDFGTGYSSLNYLTKFPFHCLKIDKSFIQGVLKSKRDEEIARAIIRMAKALELEIVAEGIEDILVRDKLEELGCDGYQGFLLGKPVPLPEWKW